MASTPQPDASRAVRVTTTTYGGADRTISVELDLDQLAFVIPSGGLVGPGWACRAPILLGLGGSAEVGGSAAYVGVGPVSPITCTYAYTGQAPPPLTLSVESTVLNSLEVSGTATMSSGSDGATMTFSG